MTGQVSDTILVYDKLYDVCGIHGELPFAAESLGVAPVPPNTACWRGYVNRYRIFHRRLVLEQLSLWLSSGSAAPADRAQLLRGPSINGVEPRLTPITDDMAENFYEGIRLELPFTGGILAGRGFLRQLYVHMGFPPAWKFQNVYEAIFEKGKLKRLHDVSTQMETIRSRMLQWPLQPAADQGGQAELTAWIASTFELDYDWDAWL
jgi:hypothetical protein